ncbi:MAG: ribosome maturation factor RimM [Sandaracinaceae bacterium]
MGVVHPHGLRGELKVILYHPGSDLDWRGRLVTLCPRDARHEGRSVDAARVLAFRRAGELAILRLEGLADRTAAERFDGFEVCLARADLPDPGDDEIYLGDLVGMRVLDDERDVGEVREVRIYPAASCAVVSTSDGELELPVHEPYVVQVDLRARVIRAAHLDDLAPGPSQPDDGQEDG